MLRSRGSSIGVAHAAQRQQPGAGVVRERTPTRSKTRVVQRTRVLFGAASASVICRPVRCFSPARLVRGDYENAERQYLSSNRR